MIPPFHISDPLGVLKPHSIISQLLKFNTSQNDMTVFKFSNHVHFWDDCCGDTNMCIISNPLMNSNWSYSPEFNAQFRSQLSIFYPVWPWNLMHDLGKQWGTSSISHQALCIQSCRWSQTSVTIRKRSIRVKIGNISSGVTLKIVDDLEKQ